MDYLNNTERRIYLRNKVELDNSEEPEPVSHVIKMTGWLLIVLINIFFAFYILLFGIQKGAKTTNAWFLSFVVGIVQDPMVNVPVLIIFYNVYLPLLIRNRMKARIEGALNADPYSFSTLLPTGPACRVAMKHPEWACGGLISPTVGNHGGNANTSPSFHAGFQKRSIDYFLNNEATTYRAPLMISFIIISVLLLLPDKIQETVINYTVSILTGGVVVGYGYFQDMNPYAAYGTLGAAIGLILLAIFWQRHKHRPSAPTTKKILPVEGDPVHLHDAPPPTSASQPTAASTIHKGKGPRKSFKGAMQLPVVDVGAHEQAADVITSQSTLAECASPTTSKSRPTEEDVVTVIHKEPTPLILEELVKLPSEAPPAAAVAHRGSCDLLDSEGQLDINRVHDALRTIHNHQKERRQSGGAERRSTTSSSSFGRGSVDSGKTYNKDN